MNYFNIYSRRYLGNKYKLLPFIKGVVEQECVNVNSFFDVFSGTGAVASAFTECQLIVNDILRSNYITALAWFSSENYDNEKLEKIITKFNSIDVPLKENYFSENFSDTYFSHRVCKKIGFIRETIEELFNDGYLNLRERAICITSLFYSMDKIAATCGHYDSFIQKAVLPQEITLGLPNLNYRLADNNIILNSDANIIAESIVCDIAYLDPPYNSRQYSDAYHLLENLALWEKPEVYGIARKMDRSNIKSAYCKSTAAKELEILINRLNARYILLSYNNNGKKLQGRSNAKISDDDIIRILSTRGDVRIFTQYHKSFSAGKGENHDNQERLFLCDVQR